MEKNAGIDKSAAGRTARRPRKLLMVLVTVLVVVCLAVAAFFAYVSDYYHDQDIDHHDLESTSQLPVEAGPNYLAFGNEGATTGIVFYPGAKVEYSAYAPLMRELAERGYLAIVVKMPFNLAFFDVAAADEVRAAYPNVVSWWVGGHSLGGSMAAQYAADHREDSELDGLLLLGAYSASDLTEADMGALVIYGSNDQVLNREKLTEGAALLPDDAVTIELEGGNHAGFGNYGPQSSDGPASLAPEDQRTETANALAAYLQAA